MSIRISIALAALAAVGTTFVDAPHASAQVPTGGRAIQLDGVQMYYEVQGAGPPLLLLHFFGGCGTAWDPFRETLARDYTLIVPDLPGHGRSTADLAGFSHRRAAEHVFALLDSLGMERISALGLSSGGMTILHMATQQPERIEAMALIGATSYFPDEAREIFIRSAPASLTPTERDEWGACSSRGDAQTTAILDEFHQMKDSYEDMNFTSPLLGTITARTLIVHGDRDRFFPVEIPLEMYRSIPRSSLWIVPEGGHIPIFGEWANPFEQQVKAFLKGEAGQR